jgi:hypothetical protein
MPSKISNSFAFSFNPKFILIMGGITKKDMPNGFIQGLSLQSQNNTNTVIDVNKTFEIQNRVHVLKITENDTKFKWKQLAPFPFKKKVGNIVYNNYGKFFCFIIENNNRELP